MRTRRNTTGSNNGSKIKKTTTKKIDLDSRPGQLNTALSQLWELGKVRKRNDDYAIGCIEGLYDVGMSKWPAIRLQRYRICTNIDSKIKTKAPLKSTDQLFKDFASTQIEPILSPYLSDLLSRKIDSYFADFDYDAVLSEVLNPDRAHYVTPGSSFPQLMAPVCITNGQSNADVISAMSVGDMIFTEQFSMVNIFEGPADGKMIEVPKNYKTGRAITLPSRELTDDQMVINNALRDYVTIKSRTRHHIIQFDDQTIQHDLLRMGYATIDLSSASDRIYRKLLMKVWPDFMDHFDRFLPKKISADNRIIDLTCIGTQGFPLTFTVMAIICGLIVETVKTTTYPTANYGDDMIVHMDDFEAVYTALESLGLVVNRGKTHVTASHSPFTSRKRYFLESCGSDVMFTSEGARVITPVYLRGVQDVDVIQFFHQLCTGNLISPDDATSIMDKLSVDYYAFEFNYQQTEFHFPHGSVKRVPKALWNSEVGAYLCKVPFMKNEVSQIKGLSKKESSVILELLHLEASMKNPNIYRKYHRGTDPIARPHGLFDLQDHRLYNLYKDLSTAESQGLFKLVRLAKEYENIVSLQSLAFYIFITSEMYKYKFSSPTEDFSNWTTREITLSDFINEEFGINSEAKYPIYRYTPVKDYKTITHPKSNEILGVTPKDGASLKDV